MNDDEPARAITRGTVLTAGFLRERGGDEDQVEVLARLWPGGLRCPTPRERSQVARRAVEAELGVDRVARAVLSSTAMAFFDRAVATARDAVLSASATGQVNQAVYKEAVAVSFFEAWAREGERGSLTLTFGTVLTAELLRRCGDGEGQAEVFARVWPGGLRCPTTQEQPQVARRAAEAGLNVDWIARSLLSPAALVPFERAMTIAQTALLAAPTTGQAAYKEAVATAFFAAWAGEAL